MDERSQDFLMAAWLSITGGDPVRTLLGLALAAALWWGYGRDQEVRRMHRLTEEKLARLEGAMQERMAEDARHQQALQERLEMEIQRRSAPQGRGRV